MPTRDELQQMSEAEINELSVFGAERTENPFSNNYSKQSTANLCETPNIGLQTVPYMPAALC